MAHPQGVGSHPVTVGFENDPSGSRPPATAIVCTRGRAALLEECLQHLAAELRKEDELIVVESGDGGAQKALAAVGTSGPATNHIRIDRPGKSHQANLGIRAARGQVLLFTDDDVTIPSGWADAMSACFVDPTVGIAFGRVIGLTSAPGTGPAEPVEDGEAPYEPWSFAHGAAMAIRSASAWHAGGFDERLGPGAAMSCGEDHDLLLRIRERGWGVVVSSAPPAVHLGWRSDAQERRNALEYERGGGAVIGAAVRRSPRSGAVLLRRRLGYQRGLLGDDRRFGLLASAAFAHGVSYGMRLAERDWLRR